MTDKEIKEMVDWIVKNRYNRKINNEVMYVTLTKVLTKKLRGGKGE